MTGHHIIPLKTYMKVAAALYALTILTVLFHQMPLGILAAPVAFLIATVKGLFVLLYFMHLKYDNNMNRVVFASAFAFLFLLWFLSVLDIYTRVPQLNTL